MRPGNIHIRGIAGCNLISGNNENCIPNEFDNKCSLSNSDIFEIPLGHIGSEPKFHEDRIVEKVDDEEPLGCLSRPLLDDSPSEDKE